MDFILSPSVNEVFSTLIAIFFNFPSNCNRSWCVEKRFFLINVASDISIK